MKDKLLAKKAELASRSDELYSLLFDSKATIEEVKEIDAINHKLELLDELIVDLENNEVKK